MAGKKVSYRLFFVTYFVLFVVLFSVEIKQEPPETESITENGQSKEEDDTKEAGELVSKDLMIKLKLIDVHPQRPTIVETATVIGVGYSKAYC